MVKTCGLVTEATLTPSAEERAAVDIEDRVETLAAATVELVLVISAVTLTLADANVSEMLLCSAARVVASEAMKAASSKLSTVPPTMVMNETT
jgi:hypothetical protein